MTEVEILCRDLAARGWVVPERVLTETLASLGMTLTGGARTRAEGHLAEHHRVSTDIVNASVHQGPIKSEDTIYPHSPRIAY